jgi:nucleoside-diphosphate-sugar epimerase
MNSVSTTSLAPAANRLVSGDETVLVTGAAGFIGRRVVHALLKSGCRHVRCLTRRSGTPAPLQAAQDEFPEASVEVLAGNLLSRDYCRAAAAGVSRVYHLAAGVDKSFPGCVLNSVVTTRNLLDAVAAEGGVKRFVNVSSFAVYSNEAIARGGVVDERCAVDAKLAERYDPYAYGKAKQDEIVREYGETHGLPYVIVRPGLVIGPGKARIPGRVGIDTFGVFLHLGHRNQMPFTYVDNCAEAIVLAGVAPDISGEVINVVDDNLPRSRDYLRQYKQAVRRMVSIPVPYSAFMAFSYLWERYSTWSEGQLPPVFNRRVCEIYFKGQRYSNAKAKSLLGWSPRVPMNEALDRAFAYARQLATSHD